jgi:hypothetical protein
MEIAVLWFAAVETLGAALLSAAQIDVRILATEVTCDQISADVGSFAAKVEKEEISLIVSVFSNEAALLVAHTFDWSAVLDTDRSNFVWCLIDDACIVPNGDFRSLEQNFKRWEKHKSIPCSELNKPSKRAEHRRK